MATKTKWIIDPAHSEIEFKTKHLVISTVTGKFNKFDGKISATDEEFSEVDAEFTAEVDSIDTNQSDRDAHLKSADFFDAANHPKIHFVSTSWVKKSTNSFRMDGDLTIRGTTKPISLEVEFGGTMKDPWGNLKAGFSLTGIINRKEFGLMWNAVTEAGGLVVAEQIKLVMNVEVSKQA